MVQGQGSERPVAFVLGGGGVLGAVHVGMLRALVDADIQPDLVLGTSVGALNGAFFAANATRDGITELGTLWSSLAEGGGVFSGGVVARAATAVRTGTHLHGRRELRELLRAHLPERIEDLPLPFQCVAASIERAAEHWFDSGPLHEAVLASCAVPGLLAPVRVGDEHFFDGGLVNSIPMSRAFALGARTVYVLQVGRVEKPLTRPRLPWQVAHVAFEIARRHRFAADLATLPDDVTVHVLPAGVDAPEGLQQLRYRNTKATAQRVERAYEAAAAYLSEQT